MSNEALDEDQRANAVIAGKPSYTIEQAAAQLDRSGLSWSDTLGQATTVTYAYRESAPAQMPDGTTGFQQFGGQQIGATEAALKLWSEVSGITFQRVSDSSGYSNNATILFGDYTGGGSADASAFAYMPGNRSSGSVAGDVWVNSSLTENIFVTNQNDYGFLTLVHEIGHAIGLSHPSDYDASDQGATISYQQNASYYEDSLEYSVMSYFDAAVTGSTIENTLDAPGGPLIDDIAAAQRLYGANPATSAGDTIYGYDYSRASGNLTSDEYLHSAGGPVWGTIWDGGGVDTIDFSGTSANQKIDLRTGAFSDVGGAVGDLSIALGAIIENASGGSGNDTLIGNNFDNMLRGNAGSDALMGGVGNDTYVGGAGSDTAILGGNTHDYTLIDGGSAGLILHGINGSGNSWIDPSTEIVKFQNGQYLSIGDVHAYVQNGDVGAAVQLAPVDGTSTLNGGTGDDHLYVDADARDFTLSRVQSSDARDGDFVLTETHGDAIIHVGEAIDQVNFLDGQYLALSDLPYFVSGDPALGIGGSQDDLIYQTAGSGYEFFDGGTGNDSVFLNGNVGDYRVRAYDGSLAGGAHSAGVELVATNDSGALLIDDSVETVHFRNGQYLALGDVAAYVAAAPASTEALHFFADQSQGGIVMGSDAADRLLLNFDASDFTLSRAGGDFVLTHGAFSADIAETIDDVQFANGQYLALQDLPSYVSGNAVYTDATGTGDVNDILVAGFGGDQYLIGAGGTDQAFLHGNVSDFTLQAVSDIAVPYDPYAFAAPMYRDPEYLTGYELVADNGSGNIYIDQSTEIIHFQNGQYLAFNDLSHYIG